MDKRSARVILERLRARCEPLREEPRLGGDFYQWYLEVLDALEQIFGRESDDVMEFQQIPFEIDQGIIRQLRRQLAIPPDVHIPQDSYYLERLYQAEEFLLAKIITLQEREADPPLE
jgi:hypothetical protein